MAHPGAQSSKGKAKVVGFGTYTLGPAAIEQPWVYDARFGALGHGPLQRLVCADLRPWEGAPSSQTVDYRRLVTALDSGHGRLRFSSVDTSRRIAGAVPSVATAAASHGTGTVAPYWTGFDGTGYSDTCMGTFVAAWDDWDSVTWYSAAAPTWASIFGATPGTVYTPGRYPQTNVVPGPEILSALAGNNMAEYDLAQLASGCRFVAVWVSTFWVGPDPLRNTTIRWTVEDAAGFPHNEPITICYPIGSVTDTTGVATEYLDPDKIVAQVNTCRFGAIPFTYSTASSLRVTVANGCGTAMDAYLVPYIGGLPDNNAALGTATVVAAATATSANFATVFDNTMIGPYSWVNVAVVPGAAAGAFTGPIIVNVVSG